MGVAFTVIDNEPNDPALQYARGMFPNYVPMGDPTSFVCNVLRHIGYQKISKLDVIAHGAPGIQSLGGGANKAFNNIPKYCMYWSDKTGLNPYGILYYLRGRFESNAVVKLHGCQLCGQQSSGTRPGLSLISSLAKLWKVKVQAGEAIQKVDNSSWFEGMHYWEAEPNGTVSRRFNWSVWHWF